MEKEEFEEIIKVLRKTKQSYINIIYDLKSKYHLNINQASAVLSELYNLKVSQARKYILYSRLWQDDVEYMNEDTKSFIELSEGLCNLDKDEPPSS